MNAKRLTIFAGHYGSGKTNIAVNYALWLKNQGHKVTVADMDTVNPYFRTKDSAEIFMENGINLIASAYAGSNVDLPALPSEIYALTEDKSSHAVIDIGGDDRGAYALGRLTPEILKENDYEAIFVINKCRPLISTPENALGIMREIESASGIPFTAIANNTNLGEATTVDTINDSMEYTKAVSELAKLPVKFVSVKEGFEDKITADYEIFPMKLQKKII